MDLQQVVKVLMTERQPQEDLELTSLAPSCRERARALLQEERCLPAFILCSLAGRFGAPEVSIDCSERKLNFRFGQAQVPSGFLQSQELLGWWWLLVAEECKAWLAVVQGGQVELLGWDGHKVFRNSGPAPSGSAALEFQAGLPELQSPVFSAVADKKILDHIREGFIERARVFPLPLYFNGVMWEWPLDIKLERVCSFTSYNLLAQTDQELGFAVCQPWAHGCRYWLTRSGQIVDMVAKGASDTQQASGNICYMPALGDSFKVQRRLNVLRPREELGIELSPVQGWWGKHSLLPGFETYLLSSRTVVFGQHPPTRLRIRPLRVRQLLMQTDQLQEGCMVVPVKDGMTLDPVYVASKVGGVQAWSVCPPELETSRQGRSLADREVAARWARGIVETCQAQQRPILE